MWSFELECLSKAIDRFFQSLYPSLHHTFLFLPIRVHGQQNKRFFCKLPQSHKNLSYHVDLNALVPFLQTCICVSFGVVLPSFKINLFSSSDLEAKGFSNKEAIMSLHSKNMIFQWAFI